MKRIRIETADRVYFAKPLTLSQLEQFEPLLEEIAADSEEMQTKKLTRIPIATIKKQGRIVLSAMQAHDKTVESVADLSMSEITGAFAAVLSGSGLVEVGQGNAEPGA